MNGEVPANSTPKKIYIRSSVCRLCGGANESRHMLRILSKTGLEKYLPSKVYYTTVIALQSLFVENVKHSSTRYATLQSVKICKLNLNLNNTVQ